MAITVCGNCIEFGGSYTLCSTAPGFSFNGVIKAESGFCDTRPAIQGDTFGFSAGGQGSPFNNPGSPPFNFAYQEIERFSFASGGSTTDAGDLTCNHTAIAGSNSGTNGYALGGGVPSAVVPSPYAMCRYYKFPYGTGVSASFVGFLGGYRSGAFGFSSPTNGCGFVAGGFPASPANCTINSFPYSSDENVTCVGSLGRFRFSATSHSSETDGFIVAGEYGPGSTITDSIECFPFSSGGSVSDIGELGICIRTAGENMSETDGFTVGGDSSPFNSQITTITKFPFSSSTSGSDIGELLCSFRQSNGSFSSRTRGFSVGGSYNPAGEIIDFPFASGSPSTAVGCLSGQKRDKMSPNMND